jgi:UPF0716 protein FxsA
MRLGLLLLFIAFPFVELALLIRAGQLIGLWPTLAIVATTAAAGAMILHGQGRAMMHRAIEALEQGRPPVEPLVDGVFLVLAGVLLVAPGLITDTLGLLLLIPPVRRLVAGWSFNLLGGATDVRVEVFARDQQRRQPTDGPSAEPFDGGPVIEGEFERLEERNPGTALRGSPDRNQKP